MVVFSWPCSLSLNKPFHYIHPIPITQVNYPKMIQKYLNFMIALQDICNLILLLITYIILDVAIQIMLGAHISSEQSMTLTKPVLTLIVLFYLCFMVTSQFGMSRTLLVALISIMSPLVIGFILISVLASGRHFIESEAISSIGKSFGAISGAFCSVSLLLIIAELVFRIRVVRHEKMRSAKFE